MISYFIIGAQKAGTTSLKYSLSKFSNVYTHDSIECTYFYNKDEYKKGTEYLFKKYFFNKKKQLCNGVGLIKHSSACFYEETIQRALEYNPNMQFILICRNPVERYISSYFMEVERSGYSKTIEESIDLAFNDKCSWEYKGLNLYGKYDLITNKLLNIISEKNLHVVLFEDFRKTPNKILTNLANKLKLKNESRIIETTELVIKNRYKVYRSKWLVDGYNKLRQSTWIKYLKEVLPSSYVYHFNQFYNRINQRESGQKPEVSFEVYDTLYKYYKQSIEQFESQNNIKTNWLLNR